ncbi:MAG: amino acid ABC transporter permease [Deltaproteobacteria bacterium]|jgi:polar amino acid transport system permease protein|nr:amino acid ABC transporter permease [Deltaproteobacteria bacterium]
MLEDIYAVAGELPYILFGSLITLEVVFFSLALGLVLGIPLALAQVYGPPALIRLVGLYVWFFRGTPILVLLYLFYFGLFIALRLDVSALASSCIVLGLTSAAYQAQIFRGGIEALPHGQLKAARALGMSDLQGIRHVILPQALRLALPGWSNEFSILLKDSALVHVLGVPELLAASHHVASRTGGHFTYYILAGLIYLSITLVGLKLLRGLEAKTRLPGHAHA